MMGGASLVPMPRPPVEQAIPVVRTLNDSFHEWGLLVLPHLNRASAIILCVALTVLGLLIRRIRYASWPDLTQFLAGVTSLIGLCSAVYSGVLFLMVGIEMVPVAVPGVTEPVQLDLLPFGGISTIVLVIIGLSGFYAAFLKP